LASITIRNLDEPLKARLRLRAARQGHSMEEEVRRILRAALIEGEQPQADLGAAIARRFAPWGGVDLADPGREPLREPPKPEG
jgi:plasmid stability protein